MEKEKPMKWYKASQVMSLIFGIFSALGTITMVLFFCLFSFVINSELPMQISTVASSFMTMFGFGCIVYIAGTVMLFVTYWGLKNRKKAALYMMYAFNIGIPLMYLVSIPLQLSYADTMVLQLMMNGEIDIYEAEMMEKLMNFLIPSISIVYAAATGGALVPNTIYFNNRKDLLE